MEELVVDRVLAQMQGSLTCGQLKKLKRVLYENVCRASDDNVCDNAALLDSFLVAKEVEGCSARTLAYYDKTLLKLLDALGKPCTQVTTDDLRAYLSGYERDRRPSKVTIDNIRRIMSSFFSWLEDEDYIVKSPVRKIHRVKTATVTKETLSDEELERIREGCREPRDLAIVDLLASTGMRIGELVRLDRDDIDFVERECTVTGKGNKQRRVYFDARAKLHLLAYLSQRTDDEPALFVSLAGKPRRASIGSIECRLRDLGRALGTCRVHPHKFRRTLATRAIDKGMPIEQVQRLLGHERIDTTMLYAMVNQSNVKNSHRRYLE